MRLLRLLLPLLAVSAAAAAPSLQTVEHVDLSRYMGRWYVIAHVPNFLEKNKVGTSDTYSLLPDGRVEDIFTFHKATLEAPEKSWHGVGRVFDKTTNAEWRMRLVWPIPAGYRILELAPNYEWAVTSNETGRLFWILSRSPTISDSLYSTIVNRLMLRGLDTAKLEKVPQAVP
jgi:apolipoprotein D and lipocalin family protein